MKSCEVKNSPEIPFFLLFFFLDVFQNLQISQLGDKSRGYSSLQTFLFGVEFTRKACKIFAGHNVRKAAL